jgi:hypothetical protein
MRLLRVLAVRLGDALDRVRRVLLSWAGVAADSVRDDTPGGDDRPAAWLDYIRARAPWLVAGKRHLPSRSVPAVLPPRPDASSTRVPDPIPPAPAPTATVKEAPPDQGRGRRSVIPAVSHAAGLTPPLPTVPVAPATHSAAPAAPAPDTRATQPGRVIPPARRSAEPISIARESAPRRTMSRPALETVTRSSSPSRHVTPDQTITTARPPESLPETPSRARVVRPDAARPGEQQWPRLLEWAFPRQRVHEQPDRRPAGEPESEHERQPDDGRPTAPARPSLRGMDGTNVSPVARSFDFDDVGLWADLPDKGIGEWQVQSSRSLIQEQLHLARLLAEQAGSSWSALHS